MMNLDDIATRIAQPDTTQGSDIAAFKELTEKYPYAQIFSILYLKALSHKNDVFFEDALQKHAYRITDRMKLYDLIQGAQQSIAETLAEPAAPEVENLPREVSVAEIEPETIQIEPETTPVETIAAEAATAAIVPETEPEAIPVEKAAETIAEPGIAEIIPTDEPETQEIATTVVDFEWNAASETAEPATEEPAAPIVPEDIPEQPAETAPEETAVLPSAKPDPVDIHQLPDPQDMLELDILTHALGHVYPEQLGKSTGVPEEPAPEPEKAPEKTSVPEIQEKPVAEQPTAEPAKAPVTAQRSFTSWIRADRYSEPQELKPEKVPEPAPEPPKKQIDEIINNFIQEEPSITRPKKEFYSPTKKAKESIDPEGLIYTETLANIFAIQGNYPKAILAYEQLILTNPEKKIFFALRIHELKEKLNT